MQTAPASAGLRRNHASLGRRPHPTRRGSKPAGSDASASSGGQEGGAQRGGGAHRGRAGGSHSLPTASPVPKGSPRPHPVRENALRHQDTKDVELADLIHVHRKKSQNTLPCNLGQRLSPELGRGEMGVWLEGESSTRSPGNMRPAVSSSAPEKGTRRAPARHLLYGGHRVPLPGPSLLRRHVIPFEHQVPVKACWSQKREETQDAVRTRCLLPAPVPHSLKISGIWNGLTVNQTKEKQTNKPKRRRGKRE